MSVKYNAGHILSELQHNLEYISDEEFDALISEILKAGHIYTAAAGRSGTAARAFSNRLMHLGLNVSMLGEITCPHTKAGDLLVIISGSGETASLAAAARKAKKNGVRLALLTMDRESTIGRLADTIVILPGVSPKCKNGGAAVTSVQPMGSAFEQMAFITLDALIMCLMEKLGETSDSMFSRHADLE